MIDGVVQQNTYSGNLLDITNPEVLIGAYKYYGATYMRFQGVVDEVAVYEGSVDATTFANRVSGGGAGTAYAYDANGNRSSLDDGASVTTYGYDAFSNRLNAINASTLQRDAAGNLTADSGGNRTFTYDDTGRLAEIYVSGSLTASYVHNALGQRVRKTAGSDDVVYLYDLAGNLIAEHTASGAHIRDYVWMGNSPVAQVDAGETFSYVHFDHLGTPRLATDDTATIVWRWDSDAFGATAANDDPDGDGTGITVNLRFPGQYFDVESGLHYNYFRTYDPSTGRYLESDPIGLAGGLNSYGYAHQNPSLFVDPDGLNPLLRDPVKRHIFGHLSRGNISEVRHTLNQLGHLTKQESRQLAQQCASARKKNLLQEMKDSGLGQGARSGQHGTPAKRAGAQMIREGNQLPPGPFRDAFKKTGKQLVNQGKGTNH